MNVEKNGIEYWKIAAGEGGYNWPEQRDSNVTSVGWSDMGNLKRFGNNENAFSKDFRKKGYSSKPKQLWAFYKNVKKRDWVIACAGSKILGLGKIAGDYEFKKELHYSHCRKVEWEKIFWQPLDVAQLNLNPGIKKLFQQRSYQGTIRKLQVGKLTGQWVFEKIKKAITSRPYGIADLVEWEGLRNAPKSEQETIVLFSRMSPVLRMKISFVGTRYPDAIIRVKKWKSWVTRTAEFEFLASGFEDHEEQYKNRRCDMIICWENNWKRKPKWLRETTQIIELKKELEKII
jgi:hypothetical protein